MISAVYLRMENHLIFLLNQGQENLARNKKQFLMIHNRCQYVRLKIMNYNILYIYEQVCENHANCPVESDLIFIYKINRLCCISFGNNVDINQTMKNITQLMGKIFNLITRNLPILPWHASVFYKNLFRKPCRVFFQFSPNFLSKNGSSLRNQAPPFLSPFCVSLIRPDRYTSISSILSLGI